MAFRENDTERKMVTVSPKRMCTALLRTRLVTLVPSVLDALVL